MSNHSRSATRAKRFGLATGLFAVTLFGLSVLSEAAAKSTPEIIAPDPAAPFAVQQADGKKIYGTICGACHQTSGQGVPGLYPPLAESEWVTGDPERLARIIMHGLTGDIEVNGEVYSSTMPPFGSALKDAEIAAVATYIRSNFGNDAPAVKAATVAKVRAATKARNKPWTAKELVLSTAPIK